MNLGVATSYKLQSNRFYKNTLAVRKGAQEEGMKGQTAGFVPIPRKLRTIVMSSPSTQSRGASFLVESGQGRGGGRLPGAYRAISVCFPKSKPQQGSDGTAGLLLQGQGHFPEPGASVYALNLTSQQSFEGLRLRGKRKCIFLLAHLQCVWPFQRLGRAGRWDSLWPCLGPQWLVLAWAFGFSLQHGDSLDWFTSATTMPAWVLG